MRKTVLLLFASAAVLGAAFPQAVLAEAVPAAIAQGGSLIPVEQYRLPNGLKVIFHIDRSDPVVAVSLNAHVGSARETPGRTGFAHMFEHLFFLDSENVGKGGLDKLSARVGGSGANGSTNNDMTDYLQTVPNDALEKMIWAEADKLGYFINTVTDPVLAKEKQVVKNEKRQSNDNRPYGHLPIVVGENLFPADHPYHWPVIGSLADLDAATLDDVKQFYRRWYVPNNVTLVIAGDFDPAQARAWVEKYFGEVPAGAPVPDMVPRPANLAKDVRLFHEDNFAELPRLSLNWPTVPALHPDSWPLYMLNQLLTDGRDTPLTQVVVDERKLASEVEAGTDDGKLAGYSTIAATAFEGTKLDDLKAAFDAGFERFEKNGVALDALERVKTGTEVQFYQAMDSVLGKGRMLARYDMLTGDATAVDRDLAALRAVTPDDVMRVYRTYIKDRPHVSASFVPKGKPELALSGSTRAKVVEEPIVQGAEAAVDASASATYVRTPSSFDRTVEPPYGAAPRVAVPAVWQQTLPNGLALSGIVDHEVPLASFELSIDGGRLQDSLDRPGVAAMTARMMTRGTARKTPAELENALKSLGARIAVFAEDERFVLRGRTLARNFDATIALLEEMLLEPRWDAGELALAKAAAVNQLREEAAQPTALARQASDALFYGKDHILSRNALGSETSIGAMTMADLKAYHAAKLAPNIARFRVVGDLDETTVRGALTDLGNRWAARQIALPEWPVPAVPDKSTVYFYDVPGAKQSVLMFVAPGPRRADPDFYPATVMNYRLGGGGFASRLTQELREGKGYTYGVSSGFEPSRTVGDFVVYSPVRANVTLEAAALARDVMAAYPKTFTPEDLVVTKAFLTKSRARSFETAGAKLSYLANVGDYRLPLDYPAREQAVVDAMTVDQIRALGLKYVRPDAMRYVIVGDSKTQEERLGALGYGAPVTINSVVDEFSR